MSSHPILVGSVPHPPLCFLQLITFIDSYVSIPCNFKWKQMYILMLLLSYTNTTCHKHHPVPSLLHLTMYPGLFLFSRTYAVSLFINLCRQIYLMHTSQEESGCIYENIIWVKIQNMNSTPEVSFTSYPSISLGSPLLWLLLPNNYFDCFDLHVNEIINYIFLFPMSILCN